jgi:hypothetical protein
MKLVHYSTHPIYKVYDNIPVMGRDIRSDKPVGFWVSDDDCEDNWFDWCLGENWGLDHLKSCCEVICDHSKLLILKSKSELRSFSHEYKIQPYKAKHPDLAFMYGINWPKVGESYAGIVITPYIWECKNSVHDIFHWYWGWDCASGCIWNASIISEIKQIPIRTLAEVED